MRYFLAATMLLLIFLCGVWDIWVVARGRSEEQVSVVLHSWSIIYPILPLLTGLLLGHIFWPNVSVALITK